MNIVEKIHWLGHASFRIDGSSCTIYIDPWKLKKPQKADVVLVTHEHFDHLSGDDIKAIIKDDSVVVAPPHCKTALVDVCPEKLIKTISPGQEINLKGIKVRATPAYNTHPSRQNFHPREDSKPRVGYIVTVDGETVYHAGDTDYINEMEELCPDVLLIPVGGTYTMGPSEAAEAARKIKPQLAIPMHWGDIVGSETDANKFAQLYGGKVKILKME